MAESCPTVVEMQFAAGVWTDVSDDVMRGVSASYGISGTGPNDRCAGTGTCVFRLKNHAWNSASLQGYYSPGHASLRVGFDRGTPVRWRHPVDGAFVARTFHVGRIADIVPVPGLAHGQYTTVTSVDWMDDAAEAPLSGIDTQISKRADELLTTLLASVTTAPVATDFSVGDSTFTYAFDNLKDESTKLLSVFATLAQSEGGYVYLRGDGTLVFESRTKRSASPTVLATLDNTMQDLTVARSRADLINLVRATIHPRRIDAAATTVLWSRNIANSETAIEIGPYTILNTLIGAYGDPLNNRARCGGTAMVAPVATTDYVMSAAADGTGADLTASLSVTANLGGNGVSWILENTGAVTGYVTKLQCRGKGIYDRAPVIVQVSDAVSLAAVGTRLVQVDMPYQDDANSAMGYAEYLLRIYSPSQSRLRQVSFLATASSALLAAALDVEIGSRVAVAETVSGIDAEFFVQSCAFAQHGDALSVTWTLVPGDTGRYWLLGTAGSSELDLTTVLGYA